MEVQVKTEQVEDTSATQNSEDKKHPGDPPKKVSVVNRNRYSGRKDYNSRYTTKYSHGQYLWTEQRIFDLIRLYKEYIEANPVYVRNQRPMWESISSKMRDMGHTKCTDDHCHTKYRTLIRQYKVICDRGTPPEDRHLEFPYFDALSEVYEYKGNKTTEADITNSEDDSIADDKLSSLLVNINKDKKEQDKKRLEKLEEMHKEKMDMFSSFLKTVSKKPANQSPPPTRSSKRLGSSRKRSAPPFNDDFILDSSELDDDESSADADQELQEFSKKSPTKGQKKSSKEERFPTNSLTSLIKKLNEERKEREEMKMQRLEKMHEEKMKLFSAFLDVIKKIKK